MINLSFPIDQIFLGPYTKVSDIINCYYSEFLMSDFKNKKQIQLHNYKIERKLENKCQFNYLFIV